MIVLFDCCGCQRLRLRRGPIEEAILPAPVAFSVQFVVKKLRVNMLLQLWSRLVFEAFHPRTPYSG